MLAESLGLDVEAALSVRWLDDHLFIDAWLPDGPTDALDALELVQLVECDGRTWVLVRLPTG